MTVPIVGEGRAGGGSAFSFARITPPATVPELTKKKTDFLY